MPTNLVIGGGGGGRGRVCSRRHFAMNIHPSLILNGNLHLFPHFFFAFHQFRYPDGTVKLRNPNIELMDQDILYHLALGSGSHDLVEMFGDVKVSEH